MNPLIPLSEIACNLDLVQQKAPGFLIRAAQQEIVAIRRELRGRQENLSDYPHHSRSEPLHAYSIYKPYFILSRSRGL